MKKMNISSYSSCNRYLDIISAALGETDYELNRNPIELFEKAR